MGIVARTVRERTHAGDMLADPCGALATQVVASGWFDDARGVEECVQAAALVMGGGWAYLKYGRGRPFISRAEVGIQATPVKLPDRSAIRVEAEFRNVGACRTTLSVRTVEVFGAVKASPHNKPIEWGGALMTVPVFEIEDWVEAGETIRDELLIPVPAKDGKGDDYIAYQVRCDVKECGESSWYHSEKSRWRHSPQPTVLHAQAVVAAGAAP